MGNWQLGWDALSAVATALAAVVALGIWMADRRRSRVQDASKVTLQVHTSLRITDSELTPGEVRAISARLAQIGVEVADARRPFEGQQTDEETFRVRAEIGEEFGSYAIEEDGSVVRRDFRGSTVEVELTNHASLSAYDIVVTGDEGGRGLTWDVVHPGDAVTRHGDSTMADLGWAVASRSLVTEFTMGGQHWWVVHGRPAKLVRWRLLRKIWREVKSRVNPPRYEFKEYTTTGGTTWKTLKDDH